MDEPTVLAGPPTSLSGVLPYRNTTDAPVTITEVTIDEEDSSTTLVVPVAETVVEPGRRRDIGVELRFPPQTPPGAYQLDITVADTELQAVAHVAEMNEAGLSPTAIVIANVPGATTTSTVVVANAGNMDVHVADFGDVDLHREDAARTTLVRLATSRLLDDVEVDQLPAATQQIRVAPAGGRQVIPPGATRAVELAVTLPKDLSQTVRWMAGVPIATRSLLIVVVPAGPAQD